jgi:hypothetical protein
MPQPKRSKRKPAPSRAARPDASPGEAPITFLECIPRYLAADLTQRAAIEKKTIVQVVEDALRAYLAAPGAAPSPRLLRSRARSASATPAARSSPSGEEEPSGDESPDPALLTD